MNYGSNTTLLEIDTKNRYRTPAARTHRTHRQASTESDGNRSDQSSFSTLAKVPATEMLASLVAAVIVVGAIASAAIIA